MPSLSTDTLSQMFSERRTDTSQCYYSMYKLRLVKHRMSRDLSATLYRILTPRHNAAHHIARPTYINNTFFFFFFYWRYNPLRVLAFSVILLHSVLSLLSFLHPLIPNVWMSSSVSSTHLFLRLPLILLPVGFHSNILLGILFSSIRMTCPNQAILLLFMNLTMSAFPMSSFNS